MIRPKHGIQAASACLLVAVFCGVGPAGALQEPPVSPGDRLRVRSPLFGQVTGDFVSLVPGGLDLQLRDGRVERFDFARVRTVERSLGIRSQIGQGALVGAVVGFIPGAVLGALFVDGICDVGCENTFAEVVLGGLLFGALAAVPTTLIGVTVGALAEREVWERVTFDDRPPSAAASRRSVGVDLGLTPVERGIALVRVRLPE